MLEVEPRSVPRRLCPDERSALWSLWEMLELRAEAFATACTSLESLMKGMSEHPPEERLELLGAMRFTIRLRLKDISQCCEILGTPTTLGLIDEFFKFDERSFLLGTTHWEEYVEALPRKFESIRDALAVELKSKSFLYLEPRERGFFTRGGVEIIGEKAFSRFPSIVDEVLEASKCLALDRNTAAVFHAMRCGEAVSKAIWVGLDRPQRASSKAPISWGDWRAETDARLVELKCGKGAARPEWWSERKDFYEELHGHLSAMYVAWRNPAMHLEKSYGASRAHEIFSAVTALIRAVSRSLDESGQWHAL